MVDDDQILDVARNAARVAGEYLKTAQDSSRTVEFKGEVNLVTEFDRRSQEMICNILKEHFPAHSILAEEDLSIEKDRDLLWVIDPIDGTTNFAHSLPMYCVSIAFMMKGKYSVGVVYLPVLDEMFYAVRGSGAFLNGTKIKVSAQKDLGNSLLATGFPYDRREHIDDYIKPFKRFVASSRGVRRMGSAAIDLAYTAAGRFDGFWEYKLQPWDTAAGFLLVEEAGGKVTDFSGNPYDPFMKEILASNGQIHGEMIEAVNQ
jgi:myo-inositol-1(or 4)-monophosphatase